MADIKISQLGEALAVTDNDILPMTASGVTSKVKASTMKSYMVEDLDVSNLHDTTITTPTDNDGLVYNGTSQKWENKQITTKEQWKKNGAYNLLENTASSQVVQGVTFTVNPTGYKKGAIKLYSTAAPTGGVDFKVNAGFKLPAGTYKLVPNDFPSTANSSRISVTISGGAELAWDANYDNHAHCEFTLSEEKELIYHIYMNTTSIGTLNNIIIYPMITTDINATYDDYAPYAMTNRELTELTEVKEYSFTSSYTVNALSKIYKCGKICNLTLRLESGASAISSGATIATIPSDVKPLLSMVEFAGNVSETSGASPQSYIFTINNNGVLTCRSQIPASKLVTISTTYICN